ncbi:hypothetical protein C943_00400 [Mariniradius saccharolyticus AK6]|uniref:Uncharacterized protein n=1 Tax=Mariniradius saccharolyticus AK6 TaxID=1239962 RepID=M7XEZ6_9BACT|nr:hypothetical protein C943_00400 [Mariniradius saccharolyticus AK6]
MSYHEVGVFVATFFPDLFFISSHPKSMADQRAFVIFVA